MLNLDHIILIDHHCHSLLNDFALLDAIGFRQAFSETRSLSMLDKHVPNSVHYMHMLRQLGIYLDTAGEKQIIAMRSELGKADYIQMLFDDASLGGLIVDAGFRSSEMMVLDRFSQLCGRPLYQCLRLESIIEDCLVTAGSFEELRSLVHKKITKPSGPKVVALKTIAAYRGGLDLEVVSVADANKDFDRAKAQAAQKDFRIMRCPLYHYLLTEAFELAQSLGFPVQIHSGLGDQDADLREANPWCLRPILESRRLAKTNFVFLHCYPYVKEAALLASIYNNVYIDLSLALTLISPQAGTLFADALSAAPFTKVLVATDGHSVPETYWYASHSARQGLTSALGFMMSQRFLDEEQAMMAAACLFHKNAQDLYQLNEI